MPRVSVIIPTYGHRDTVLETLESVFSQTFTDYEVIVVNDGSPDDTATVLAPLAAAKRVRYVEQSNAGVAAARNAGLSLARGSWTAFLDDDDIWPANKLEWQVQAASANDEAALIYGYMEPFGEPLNWPTDRDAPTGQVLYDFLRRNWILSPGQTLIRTATLRSLGGFDQRFWGTDDYNLYLTLAAKHPFIYEKRLALRYRSHAANASRDVWRMYVNARRVQRHHLGWFPWPGRYKRWIAGRAFMGSMRRYVGGELLSSAHLAAAAGDRTTARRQTLRAVVASPTLLRRSEALAYLLGREWQ